MNEVDQWKYRCICDPGYGPKTSGNYTDQYLCHQEIEMIDNGKQCAPLQILEEVNDKSENVWVDHKFLCNVLEPGQSDIDLKK